MTGTVSDLMAHETSHSRCQFSEKKVHTEGQLLTRDRDASLFAIKLAISLRTCTHGTLYNSTPPPYQHASSFACFGNLANGDDMKPLGLQCAPSEVLLMGLLITFSFPKGLLPVLALH